MKRLFVPMAVAALAASLLVLSCTQAAPAPAPTKAPAAPAAPTKAAEPAKAAEPTKASAVAPTAAPTAVPAPKVSYPEKGKTITLIVATTAGGTADISSRIVASLVEKDLGVSIQVVNKPGATTQVGMTELAQTKPDGYTIGVVQLGTFFSTYLDPSRKAIYTGKDFQPVANLATMDNVLTVGSSSPFKDLKGLVDAAKANPEKVKVATAGILSNTHLVPLKLEDVAGARFAYVHFPGGPEVNTAVMSGNTEAGCGSTGETMALYKAGNLRILATTGKQQSTFMPDVKSAIAQGYNFSNTYNVGWAVRAGTPVEIVDILSASVKKALQNEDIKSKLIATAMEPDYMDRAQYTSYWNEYEANVKPLVAKALAAQK